MSQRYKVIDSTEPTFIAYSIKFEADLDETPQILNFSVAGSNSAGLWGDTSATENGYYSFNFTAISNGAQALRFSLSKPAFTLPVNNYYLDNVVIKDVTTDNPPVMLAYKDYYPFGMPMPNRNVQGNYRYAFQGQEKDEETGLNAFELRLWDARIGRWLTTDPYGQHASPYMGMGNNPISNVDPDGGMDCPNPPCNQNQPPGTEASNSNLPIDQSAFGVEYGGVIQLEEVVVMAPASSYDYSQETIPGKFQQDWNYILNGIDGNAFTRFGDIFSRDWNQASPSERRDFGIDVSTSIIPGGFILRNGAKLGKGGTKLANQLLKHGNKSSKLPTPDLNRSQFIKLKGGQGYRHVDTGAIYKKSHTTHGSVHGTQWKAYPKGTTNFGKQQGNRLTIDGDGTLIGN